MKKLLLLLLAIPFVFTSCSDDDDDRSLVGTWRYESYDAKIEGIPAEMVTQLNAELGQISDLLKVASSFNFTDTGKFTANVGEDTYIFDYTYVGSVLTVSSKIDDIQYTLPMNVEFLSDNSFRATYDAKTMLNMMFAENDMGIVATKADLSLTFVR